MHSDIQQRAHGRWYGILCALGVESNYLRNKHGPCPRCGGKDRYRWDNKDGKGTFFCNECGAGDGFELLKLVKGWGFREAAEHVESVVGKATLEAPRRVSTQEELRAAMRKRWGECGPVVEGSPVHKYLRRRTGVDSAPSILRSAPDRPAMVALMQAPDGRAAMVHTTFLTEDGRKAPMDNCRLMMPGTIAEGAAVRLAGHGDVLGIAEGIETALSATALTGFPCWAALNEVLLQKWIAPQEVRQVIVFGDNDSNYVGQSAAYMLARKLIRQKNAPAVDVRIPETIGHDWNDELRASQYRRAGNASADCQ
ncbi:toprim domain-containing protein [Bradyrhizobium genosp. L]|uniref:toprim domain-containing protein n=1 Tax=Bradyrhizobium genosp. L TaxID=83637 RepID=UPI0018A25075|nr:toprim domain-containing protein [Bradyrhizobium genosp. L]QPF87009.1 toprim domain-containing protein [Bradyrhizobium genosp. L]